MDTQPSSTSLNLFYTADRNVWRAWLEEHFETAADVWLVYPMKGSGEPCILYNDAVEEALCFGWIDSVHKRLDETHRMQRFTPRQPGSSFSQPNIERLKWMDTQGFIHPKVRPSVEGLISSEFVYPEDILAAIRADEAAWAHFATFSEPYKRIRVAFIDAARKRPEEFARRLANFLAKTRQGKLIVGYGGVDKYYAKGRPQMIGFEERALASERLTYRLLCEADKPALREMLSDAAVTEPAGFLPAKDDAAFDDFFATLTQYNTGLAILCEGVPVGYFHVNRYRSDLPELRDKNGVGVGFVIGKAWQGRGFATETLRALTAYLLTRFDYVAADHFVGNEASRRVIEKCGYRFTEEYTMFFEELGRDVTCRSYVAERE